MPGGFPEGGSICGCATYGLGSYSTSFPFGMTGLTPSSTANTKGSYSQLVTSTTYDIDFLEIVLCADYTAACGILVDIAIGSSGNETVIVSNLDVSLGNSNVVTQTYAFPISIPAGTRISARVQSSVGSISTNLVGVYVKGYEAEFNNGEGFAGVDAIGAVTATSFGTLLSPSSTTYTAYAQLVASSARDYSGIIIGADSQGASYYGGFYLDIAIGAGGSEKNVVAAEYYCSNNLAFSTTNQNTFFPIQIPAGTRISSRAASTAGYSQNIGIVVYGVYK